jgi:hypothetical protein
VQHAHSKQHNETHTFLIDMKTLANLTRVTCVLSQPKLHPPFIYLYTQNHINEPNHNLTKMFAIIFNFNVFSPPTKQKPPCSKHMHIKTNKHKKQIFLPSHAFNLCGNLYYLKSLQDLAIV